MINKASVSLEKVIKLAKDLEVDYIGDKNPISSASS